MTNKVTNLAAPFVILALLVLGCGHEAPNASNANKSDVQKGAPTVSSQDELGEQQTPELIGNPNGNCCPEGFVLEFALGDPANRNGDLVVCRKVTAAGTITIDNNFPGNCTGCPPNCGGGL